MHNMIVKKEEAESNVCDCKSVTFWTSDNEVCSEMRWF